MNERESTGRAMKRRGILAAAGAVVAGFVAKQTSQPVAASSALQIATAETGGTLNGPVIGPTFINDTNAGYTSSEPMLIVSCRNGPALAGVQGTTFGIQPGHTLGPLPPEKCGVYGDTDGLVGVLGAASQSGTGVKGRILSGSTSTDTVAVDGFNESTGVRGIGVRGDCDASFGVGVQGMSSSYYGMQGITNTGIGIVGDVKAGGAGTSNIGVLGRVGALVSNSQSNTVGVYGQNLATGVGGTGVHGDSNTGSGVVGTTTSATNGTAGVFGSTAVSNGTGLAGQVFGASTTGAAAFVGAAGAGNFAAFFTGDVHINGKLVVSDPSYKSGMLRHAVDGSNRLVYCVESPESWIEDVGSGTLTNGKATITFDKDFAAVTHTDSYHVFLTEYAETQGLFVSGRAASGFTVQERNKGATSGTFSWKVMAKARSAVKAERLATYTPPTIRLPEKPLFDLAPPPSPAPLPGKKP